jgi:ribosomal protein S18 acetylase RimI-like enzyme
MVHPDQRGKGIGGDLCRHSLQIAKVLGYRGMQFNLVVSTNTGAVALWQRLGFRIIGTIPGGFKHQKLGYVDAYIMFREIR